MEIDRIAGRTIATVERSTANDASRMAMMISPLAHIYIFLPVHNRREATTRFVQCLRNQTRNDYHLVLIDDGSTDGTDEFIRSELLDVTVLKGRGNWWWAGALQKGFAWAEKAGVSQSDVIVIMNDDTLFEPDFLSTGVRLIESTVKVVIAAQCYSQQTGNLVDAGTIIDWAKFDMAPAKPGQEIHFLSTRGMFMRFGDALTIGKLHPWLLPHYLSDYEYSHRAWKKGYRLETFPELKLRFDEKSTGIHASAPKTTCDCLRRFLSIRSSANLPSWFVFIGLACPRKWVFINWYRVLLRAAVELSVCVRNNSILGRFITRAGRKRTYSD